METNYIPEFLALAEYGSSYVAAEKLFTTQSTLLRHIQSIEDEFGMPLFDRTRKGFLLNEAGKVFLPYARQIAGLKNNCYSILHHGEESDSVVHLFAEGKVKKLIIVLPNGRSTADYGNTDWSNMQAFYSFGQEIRNDLLPWMDEHYATYGDRDHRYMAGLSMGGMQTINICLCECMDLISAFAAFSAAPTSYPAAKVAAEIKKFDAYPIRYFYNLCGTGDSIAYASASAAAKELPKYTDQLTEANFHWQECPGDHNFDIWNLGLFNFLRILGK